MKSIKLTLTAFIVLFSLFSFSNIDSLKTAFQSETNFEKRLGIAYDIGKANVFKNPDTASKYLFAVVNNSAENP